jgi:ComF family protein
MQAAIDLLLPPACPGCGAEGRPMCSSCRRPLDRRLAEPAGVPVGLPASLPLGLVQLEWCAAFTGPVRSAVHALKYDGERRLAATLGEAIAARWRRVAIGGDVLVPVPVHRQRLRERGFDQADLLAREAARHLRLPVAPALVRREETAAQHALGRQERSRNVGGAFAVDDRWRGLVAGRWPVLVDDVTTTGSTLAGCAAALLQAGALAVSALTVARER